MLACLHSRYLHFTQPVLAFYTAGTCVLHSRDLRFTMTNCVLHGGYLRFTSRGRALSLVMTCVLQVAVMLRARGTENRKLRKRAQAAAQLAFCKFT